MLSLAIQAGGDSRRMGQNKALLPFLGSPLIERVVRRLAPIADEVFIMANEPEPYLFLGLPVIPDFHPGKGPLGGLYAALQHAGHPAVAVVACDMPFASVDLFVYLYDLLDKEGADVAVPMTPLGLEPLHAVYRKDSCLPIVKAAFDAERLKMTAWFSKVRTRTVSAEELHKFDRDGVIFLNVNTPDEFQKAESYARGH